MLNSDAQPLAYYTRFSPTLALPTLENLGPAFPLVNAWLRSSPIDPGKLGRSIFWPTIRAADGTIAGAAHVSSFDR